MIYLNHSATSYPKPEVVLQAYNESINALPSAQFRSAGICNNGDLFARTREALGELFGIEDSERIYFASGSTEGLNKIIFGLPFKASEYLTTCTEHNSVLRPLFNLTDGEKPLIAKCDENGIVSADVIDTMLNEAGNLENNTSVIKAVIINHCSNVTGAVQNIEEISRVVKRHNAMLILDVSQSAGCIEIKADEWNVDALAFTGHKSIKGLQGTGGYYVRRGIVLRPVMYGGTGKDSGKIIYSDPDDYEYEVGTLNSSAIAALNAACRRILEKKVNIIHELELELTNYLIDSLLGINKIHVYAETIRERGPLVSISIEGLKPSDAAYILQSSYDIITRAGLSCAPLIHEIIGSGTDGTLRISLSDDTTTDEIDSVVAAIRDIASNI